MHILIEGVDLSGKSSVSKFLNKTSASWQRRHMSLLEFNALYEMARSIPKDGSKWIGYLYESALAYDLDTFTKPVSKTIQDSTILLRSLAYNKAAGFDDVVSRFEQLAQKHPRFDAVFVLTASLNARRQRLNERIARSEGRVTRNDQMLITDPEFFVRMDDLLISYTKRFFHDAVIIDTSDMDIAMVVKNMGL